ncbi:hypothetical protein CY34DRAFT_798173 [Suillus luteus UH-Slu-Lm8-n1]|uniref:Uncharacterized protein n=1 Tax=Suillus luteus UH-Slu-Lm8-n1 TaxID=930992 RepID=A0A0D0B2V7_9AGAM|nr:hypothetical protein CY34DRAFT_798173 [Suillus luteus UH-Slu-Lm8-n1]
MVTITLILTTAESSFQAMANNTNDMMAAPSIPSEGTLRNRSCALAEGDDLGTLPLFFSS